MSTKVLLVNPEAPAPAATGVSEAQRSIKGSGLRLGTLYNSKSNADHLLAMIVEGVKAAMPVASVVALAKPHPSLPADASVLDQLAKEADVVVSAMAD
jgi:hypothetical protein